MGQDGSHTAAATFVHWLGVGLPLLGIIAISHQCSEGLYDLGCKCVETVQLVLYVSLYLL